MKKLPFLAGDPTGRLRTQETGENDVQAMRSRFIRALIGFFRIFHHACPLDDILPILLFKLIDGATSFPFHLIVIHS